MSVHNLSAVLLIPEAHKDVMNTIAEALGYGPNNIAVKLAKTDNSVWYGCHTWCNQVFVDQIANPPEEASLIPGSSEALASLVTSIVEGGDPSSNWFTTLEANGLSVVETVE